MNGSLSRYRGPAWIILFAGLFVTVLSAAYVAIDGKSKAERQFEDAGEDFQSAVEHRLENVARVLRSAAALFAASESITREEWGQFCRRQDFAGHHPPLEALSFAAWVPEADLAGFERSVQAEGFPTFRIFPEAGGPVRVPVTFVEPFSDPVRRALGFDVFSDPNARRMLEQALDLGEPVLSGPTLPAPLIERVGPDRRLLMSIPIYGNGLPTDTVTQRREAVTGFVLCGFRAAELLTGLPQGGDRGSGSALGYRIQDGGGGAATPELIHGNAPGAGSSRQFFSRTLQRQVQRDFAHRTWTFHFSRPTADLPPLGPPAAWLVLAAGLAITLLLFAWLRSIIATGARAREIATELTRELKQSEEKYRLIFDHSPLGILSFDAEGVIVACNRQFSEIVGVPLDTLIGLNMVKLPDRKLVACVESALGGRPATYEGEYHSVNSEKVTPVRALFAPVDTGEDPILGGVGIVEDVTERKKSEKQLRDSEARNRALLNAIPDIILINDRHGTFVGYHASDPHQLYLPPDKFLDRNLQEILPEPTATRFLEAFHTTLAENTIQIVQYILEVEGEERHYEARVVPYHNGQVMTMVRNITRQVEAARQQKQLQAQLQQSQKMESLGSLAGGVAHDMNNVLGAILGLASAQLEAEPKDSPAGRALATICTAAERGGQMVKSLLSFTRQSPAEEKEFDLNQVLREEAALLERTTMSRVDVVLDLDPDLRPILGDPGALSHALMNLCVNAIDAIPESGKLTLRSRMEKDEVLVEVQDTGSGMAPDILAKAMDPFFTTKEVGKGTGLGLAMVYGTVKAHNGRVDIQSEPDVGTRVRIWFPACETVLEPEVDSRDEAAEGAQRPLKVLAIDDDELVQGMLVQLLRSLGHTPTAAWSGEEALAHLEAGYNPDLAVLDMNMPGLGGAGTLPRLRELRPDLPVILATGRADQAALDLVDMHPKVTLLSKPYSMGSLKALLRELTD